MYLMQLFLLLVLVMISVNHAVRGYRHARSTQIRKVFSLRAGAYSSLSAASDIPYASSSSAKVASLFYKQEDSATGKVDNDIEIEKVLLVPSSEFDKFKSEILDLSEQSLSMLEDAGISLNKFPGIKVIKVPLKWCNQPTNVAFYDDKVSKYVCANVMLIYLIELIVLIKLIELCNDYLSMCLLWLSYRGLAPIEGSIGEPIEPMLA